VTAERTVKVYFTCPDCKREGWFDVRRRYDGEDVLDWTKLATREAATAHLLAGGLMCNATKVDLKVPMDWTGSLDANRGTSSMKAKDPGEEGQAEGRPPGTGPGRGD
jgi:hypothetical protein